MTDDPESYAAPPPPLRVTLGVAAVIVVAVFALVVTGLLRSAPGDGDRSSPSPAPPPRLAESMTVTEAVSSLAVLRDWDRARANAWARGDVAALRRIYVPGSSAGSRDLAMLRTWVERGLRVRRMTMQVHAVELRVRTERRIVLLVTDRLADAVAVPAAGGGEARPLPRDGLTTRRLEFRLVGRRWMLAAAYARPLASTAVTSGSANS